MTRADVVVVGGINFDDVVRGARLPGPGETLAGESFFEGPGAVEAALRLAKAVGAKTVLDPAPSRPFPEGWLRWVDVSRRNAAEAEALTNVRVTDVRSAALCARVLLARGAGAAIIPAGEAGNRVVSPDERHLRAHREVGSVDATRAGDAFIAGLAFASAEGVCSSTRPPTALRRRHSPARGSAPRRARRDVRTWRRSSPSDALQRRGAPGMTLAADLKTLHFPVARWMWHPGSLHKAATPPQLKLLYRAARPLRHYRRGLE